MFQNRSEVKLICSINKQNNRDRNQMLTKARRRIKTADGYKGAYYNSADEGSDVVEVV